MTLLVVTKDGNAIIKYLFFSLSRRTTVLKLFTFALYLLYYSADQNLYIYRLAYGEVRSLLINLVLSIQ